MESQSHQNAADTVIRRADARKLLRRICKAISMLGGFKVFLNCYSDGSVCILSNDREILSMSHPNDAGQRLYFRGEETLLMAMLVQGTVLHFSPLGRNPIEIDTCKTFGSTLEELKIKLDLLKV